MTPPVGAAGVVLQSFTRELAGDAAEGAGLALVAAVLSALVAVLYRWYVRERVPSALPILVGLNAVAVYLNATRALGQVIVDNGQVLDETTALFNIAVVLTSAAAARAAVDVGDRVGTDVFVATGSREVESEVGRMVQAVGRVITVKLPEEVDDIVGYDPVPDETKAKLAGRTFVFPRRLTVEELRNRLTARLKADYAVGHVDVELSSDGEVRYLAVGSRAAGIGPTLPPETSAVAVRADPAFTASSGDLVQVWGTDPAERVLTAELRGVADDVVTLAIDAAETRKLDDTTEYKLVTLPVERRADREFASLLRAADETMAAIAVEAGSALAGQSVGALDVAVVAIRPVEGPVEPLPDRDRRIQGGESLYVVATPEAIRRVETATSARDTGVDLDAGSKLPPDQRIGPGDAVADDSTAGAESPSEPRPDATDGAVDDATARADEMADDAGATVAETADWTSGAELQREDDDPVTATEEDESQSGEDEPTDEAGAEGRTDETVDEDITTDEAKGDGPTDDPRTGDSDGDTTAEGTDDESLPDEENEAPDGDLDLGDPDLAEFEEPSMDAGDAAGAPEDSESDPLDELPGTDVSDLTGTDVDVADVASDPLSSDEGADEGEREGETEGENEIENESESEEGSDGVGGSDSADGDGTDDDETDEDGTADRREE